MPGIYIHIPYCVKKCRYCDFVSVPVTEDAVPVFCDALSCEIKLYENQLKDKTFDTVFFGGGTPSLLSGKQLQCILDQLRQSCHITDNAEISMECNPGTVAKEKIQMYKDAGVNRISVGLQSADNFLLKRIGRIHTSEDYLRTVEMLHMVGISNFNTDIMYGLPGQNTDQYLDTIRKVADTGAKHISSYSLILEEGTPLYRDVQNKAESIPEDNLTADMEDAGKDFLKELGYQRYEISNYSVQGYECRHNLNYWNNGEYIGFGPAAHSAMRMNGWTRWSNTEDIDTYLKIIGNNNIPVIERNIIAKKEEMFETVMMGLRLIDGIDLIKFRNRFSYSLYNAFPKAIQKTEPYLDNKKLKMNRYSLNSRGMDVLNIITEYFYEEVDE